MPPAPKVGDRLRDIRIIEVFLVMKAYHKPHAYCHVRISRKVEIYLEHEAEHTEKNSRGRLFGQTVEALRQHPVRSLLRWAVFLILLDIFRYLALPPVIPLMVYNPGETAMMALRREAFTEAHPGKSWNLRYRWVPLERISPWLRQAVVASEDDRFYSHHGFDLELLWQAALRNWKKGRLAAGGSTITQQLAKNLWFSPERSLLRKIKEAIMTARLELWLEKNRILELYLNVVEWGQGIFGAEAAARHYFGKSAAALSKQEAAQLAVMLPAPLKRSPRSPLVQRLSSRLMRRMY